MEIKDKRIDGGKAFDWGKTSQEYARFRSAQSGQARIFPRSRLSRLNVLPMQAFEVLHYAALAVLKKN